MAYDWTQDANCVGAWLFTEGSGTSVADSSGNGNTGNFKGAGEPAWSSSVPAAHVSNSVIFDGTDDYINAGSAAITDDVAPETWVGWIYPKSYGENNSGYIFSKDTRKFVIIYNSGAYEGTIADYVYTNATAHQRMSNNATIALNKWQYIAWHWSGTPQDSNIYVNGVEVSYQITQGTGDVQSDAERNFYIGNRQDTSRTFDGNIAEVGFFSKELDSTDINDIMDNGLKQSIKRRLLMGCGV